MNKPALASVIGIIGIALNQTRIANTMSFDKVWNTYQNTNFNSRLIFTNTQDMLVLDCNSFEAAALM